MAIQMRPRSLAGLRRVVFVVAAAVAFVSGVAVHAGEPGWQERVQVLFDPDTQTAERVLVRVADLFPDYTLSFTWEPARGSGPGIDRRTGSAEGEGRLIWRINGLPPYDDRSIFGVYEGRLVAGRPEGRGRLTLRSGEVYDGTWAHGLREGTGYLRDDGGNHYTGNFAAGLPDGAGVYTARDGTRYEGPFHNGLRHGTGTIRLPGGTTYASVWDLGREVQSDRPDVFADAMTGGLLRAQSGDDASRASLALVLDERMNAREPVQYTLQPMEGSFLVYPAAQDLIDAWNGTSIITEYGWSQQYLIDRPVEAMMYLSLGSTDGAAVDIASMWLDVSDSIAVLQPMLSVRNMLRCVGYSPHFGLVNHGWGAVNRAVLRFQFVKPDFYEDRSIVPTAGTRLFEVPLPGFADSAPVELAGALSDLGVDIARLETAQFRCSREFDIDLCLNEARASFDFGELAPFLSLSPPILITGVYGELEYFWTDAKGTEQSLTQPLTAQISLASIENVGLAEMGDAYTEYADAPSHVLVDLPLNRSAYTHPIDYRGPRNAVRLDLPIKLRAPATSIHDFRGAVQFSDGSIRYSPRMQLYYLYPRTTVDTSAIDAVIPATCTIED